jgi:hypothetical protein
MKGLLGGIGIILGIGIAVIAVLLIWSIAIGWLLTRFLPFSLFEGSLLVMVASLGAAYVFLSFSNVLNSKDEDTDDPDMDDLLPSEIPPSRFYKTDADKTWTAWMQYISANMIYAELEQSSHIKPTMNESQTQELAIRLAELSVSLLQRKSGKTPRLSITKAALKQEMVKQKLKPYDDDILDAAVAAVNMQLMLPPVESVIRKKLWDRPSPLFDVET